MDREELFKRTKGILHPDVAREEVFLFLGVGSGGARVAEEAIRFGIGTILLADLPNERMEEHNIIRHPLGYSSLGRLKVEALRERLLDINPECKVETYGLDVAKDSDELEALATRATQIHMCTDNEPSKHSVNQVCVRLGIPMFFGAVFDGGCGGEAGRIIPGGACYACIASFLNRSGRFDENKVENFDYTNPNQDQYRSTPALNIDIAQITLIQARLGLLTMLAKTDPSSNPQGNYVLFANRAEGELFPRMLWNDIWEIPRDPACMICGNGMAEETDIEAEAARILDSAIAI